MAVQREVALRIAEALEAALTAQEREQIEKAPTDNTGAYDLYLRGMEYRRRRGVENRRIAEEMYLKAVELDPDFALAYAALARHYGREYFQGRDRTQENADRIRDAAHKAVELDPDLTEAHRALADYFSTVLEDQERALEEFAVAQRLSPNCCFDAIGWTHIIRGEWEEGITNYRRAVELDPRNPDLLPYFGAFLVYMRLYDEAIPILDTYVALVPDGQFVWVKALAHLNQPDGAEKALQVRRDLEKAQGGPSPGYDMSAGSVWWYNRVSFRILHDHYRERAREPIPESATDSSGYFLAKAISYNLDGETVQARAYYDSARVAYEARIEESPERSIPTRIYSALAISYAGLGRAEDAIREATRAVELTPPSGAAGSGQAHIRALAEVYVMVGEYDAAIDKLEYLLSIYCPISTPQLRADPLWDPLRSHPRFQALLEREQ